jgi:hypothetical protein
MDEQPNILMGLVGGVIAMLLGAIIWGAIAYFTGYQIGWLAIGVGFLVGIGIRYLGKGRLAIFGISGAVLALIGCVLGNLIAYSGLIAREEGMSFLYVFFLVLTTPEALVEIFTGFFDFRDILFYALAAYFGYKTASGTNR